MVSVLLLTLGLDASDWMYAPYLLKAFALSKNSLRRIDIAHYSIDDCDEKIIDYILKSKCEVIGFSCYVWNVSKISLLTSKLKKIKPRVLVIVGGPEVSFDSKKYLEEVPSWDIIVRGEGEETFCELLETLDSNSSLQCVKGITYRQENNVIETPSRPFIENLDIIPSPILTGILDIKKCSRIPAFETLRGCAYSCAYCKWHNFRKIRCFSMERIRAELDIILNSNLDRVWFSDPVANINSNRFNEILEFIVEKNFNNIAFDFEMKAELLTLKTIKLLQKLKRGYIAFGLQSIDNQVLSFARRKTNIVSFSSKFKLLRKHVRRMDLHIDLIYGLPFDNWRTINEALSYSLSLFPDLVKLHPFMLLRGTEFYRMKENQTLPPSKLNNLYYSKCENLRKSLFSLFHPSFRLPIYVLSQASKKSPLIYFNKMENFFIKVFGQKLYDLISCERTFGEHLEVLKKLRFFLELEFFNEEKIISPLFEICLFRYFVGLSHGGVLSLRQQKVTVKHNSFNKFIWTFYFDVISNPNFHRFVTIKELLELPRRKNNVLFNLESGAIFEVPFWMSSGEKKFRDVPYYGFKNMEVVGSING